MTWPEPVVRLPFSRSWNLSIILFQFHFTERLQLAFELPRMEQFPFPP
jgi:hypothetical protein